MLKFVRSLPDWVEFAIVVTVCFGYFFLASIWVFFSPELLASPMSSDYSGLFLVYIEILSLFGATLFLATRGWDFASFQIQISWKSSAGGVLLFVVYVAVFFVIYYVLSKFTDPIQILTSMLSLGPSLPVALIVSVINPIFEEVVVVGYVFTAAEQKFDAKTAIAVSVALRLSYHLYQGIFVAASILPLGILFAMVYWRWRNLWPLILVHSVLDFLAMYRIW